MQRSKTMKLKKIILALAVVVFTLGSTGCTTLSNKKDDKNLPPVTVPDKSGDEKMTPDLDPGPEGDMLPDDDIKTDDNMKPGTDLTPGTDEKPNIDMDPEVDIKPGSDITPGVEERPKTGE